MNIHIHRSSPDERGQHEQCGGSRESCEAHGYLPGVRANWVLLQLGSNNQDLEGTGKYARIRNRRYRRSKLCRRQIDSAAGAVDRSQPRAFLSDNRLHDGNVHCASETAITLNVPIRGHLERTRCGRLRDFRTSQRRRLLPTLMLAVFLTAGGADELRHSVVARTRRSASHCLGRMPVRSDLRIP